MMGLMVCFSSIGFAAFTTTFHINGTTEAEIPYGLFITSVTTDDGKTSYIDENEVSYVSLTTTVKSHLNRSNWGTGTVTYRITVLNNTRLTYSYRGLYYQTNLSDYNGNSKISTTANRRNLSIECSLAKETAENQKVLPGETLEFTVKYTVGDRLDANTDWKTLVNYQFGINVDGELEALEVVEAKFLDVLNNSITYHQLIDALDNKFDGRQEWTSNYIGNVTGSSSEDSVAVNTLFAGQLQISVGGSKKDATVMIKHENLDGNRNTGDDYTAVNTNNGGVFNGYGCEMTLYLTIDPLNSAGRYVPVYAVVFTCDRDENGNLGEWYRIGDTYAGEANVVTYNGGNGTGSFVTDNWRADRQTYTLVDGYSYNIDGEQFRLNSYSYNVGEDVSIKTITTLKDINAVKTFKTLLDDAKRIIDNRGYAGVGITNVEDVYKKLSGYYTVDANGNHVVDENLTIVQLSPLIRELYGVVSDALIRIDALNKQQQQQ